MKFPERFFRMIFKNSLDDHELDVEFRGLHPLRSKDGFWPKQFWVRNLEEMEKLWPEITESSNRGYQVHFTVVPRLRHSKGNKEHPLPDKPIVSCLWGDLDVGEDKPYKRVSQALRAVQKLEPLPNIVVESGTGIHVYYFLEESREVSKERLERLLRSLSRSLKGDKGAAHARRLMRVPNTVNWKSEAKKKAAKVHYLSKIGHSLRDLEAAWNARDDSDNGKEHGRKEKQDASDGEKYLDFFTEHVSQLVVTKNSSEARGLCPFHEDTDPSFSVNVDSGLWKCHSTACNAEGNVSQFCKKMDIPVPASAIKRFPRLPVIPREEEWGSETVFQEVYDNITRQIRFPHSWQPVLVSLWAMGTYMYMQFPCYGHIWLNSPTTHSGKTKAEDVLSTICYKATEPQLAPTAAVVFRFPKSIGGTLILDEIDRLSPENQSDVIAVLNHYKSTGGVLRNVPGKNKQYTLDEFKVYCPKIIAGINNLPDTTQDRCFKIYLHRKKKDDLVERFMPGAREELQPLRDQLETWVVRDGFKLLRAYNQRDQLGVPAEADDRLKDMMEPLFAIATVLPRWVKEKLIVATEKLAGDRHAHEEESNPVVLGVQALRENFPEDKKNWRLRSDQALDIFEEDVPGIEDIGQAQALLRRFGFRSQRVRVGKKVLRAYILSKKALDRLVERYGVEEEVA